MTTKNKLNVLLVAAMAFGVNLAFLGTASAFPAAPSFERPAKPDRYKPVHAENIKLFKKATVGKSDDINDAKKFNAAEKIKLARPGRFATTGILGEPSVGNRYAIIVGISDYPGTAYDLNYADDDARDMITALKTLYGFDSDNIYPFIDEEGKGAVNATRANIIGAIQEIEGVAGPDDEVVFFFSGHGMSGNAADGDTEFLDESIVAHDGTNLVSIWDGELRDAFAEFKTSRIVFIFDSCLAGGMTDLMVTGRIINMATTETGTAYEYASMQNGQFSYYFVDMGMLRGFADKYDHDKDLILMEGRDVVIEEAFDYAKQKSIRQTPVISDLFANDLLL
ncbi:caspase family protein [Patescibacteria group bacterium]|nr:caspase family protein [Patescibacteria group bacterium]MBU4353591.1 caspase family protein [Patescibacteria group bacterium]MBU4476900.1 caspase family protein [Patescibacteria group bacterium]MCG2699079.1 caspase family protein [Candidatus Parcubacteria bacterium]